MHYKMAQAFNLVEEPLGHFFFQVRGEDSGGLVDRRGRPLLGLRQHQQILPIPETSTKP